MRRVLTIAGSDPSGGAGIQADLKTMCALGVFGMSAVTAVTVQNTQKVYDVQEINPEIVSGQVEAVLSDIGADAVKIGMIPSLDAMRAVRDRLLRHKVRNIVLDPVMVSKSGCRLLKSEVELELITLFPLAEVVTPNLAEAAALSGLEIARPDDMIAAARKIQELGARNVLVKGGGWTDNSDDFLLLGDVSVWLRCPHIDTKNTHGTGCTLSSAIACNLAGGASLRDAVERAKDYVTQAIRDSLDIGHGVGPLGHLVQLYRAAGVAS